MMDTQYLCFAIEATLDLFGDGGVLMDCRLQVALPACLPSPSRMVAGAKGESSLAGKGPG